jgi:hypothetical protein
VIVGRLADELVEETDIFPGLRMPEDTHGEALFRILDRLHGSVVGTCRDTQPVTDAADTLMVM